MDPKELKRVFQRGKCLSLETMRLYNEGGLSAKSNHEVEKHLIECSLCASAIEGLSKRRINEVSKVSTNINKRLAVYMNTPPTTPILSRFGVAVIVSSAVVILGLATWLTVSQFSNDRPPADKAGEKRPVSIASETPKSPVQTNETDIEERPQNTGAVPVQTPTEDRPEISEQNGSTLPINLPASQPGNTNTLEAERIIPNTETPSSASSDDNTRQSSAEQLLRIKSIVVYPPVTHNDQKPKQKSSDGQLTRSSGGSADFSLDEMPGYAGGNEALKSYIISSFKPQKEDKSKMKKMSTGVLFQVNSKTGEVSSPQLSFSISPATDAELLRVIENMPDWNPGKKRGTVDVMLGITFE